MADPWSEFSDATDTGSDPWTEFSDAETPSAAQKKKEKKPGFFKKFGSGLGEIARIQSGLLAGGDANTIGEIPKAAQTFAGGSARALESAGRGVMSPLGDLDSTAIAGLSELADAVTGNDTGTFAEKRQQDIANKEALKKEQGIANLVGEGIGFGRGAGLIRSGAAKLGLKTGLIAEGGILGGLESGLSGGNLQDIAQGAGTMAAFGGAGKLLAKPLSALGSAVASRVGDALRKGSGAVSKRAVRAIAARTKSSAEDVESAILGWTKIHGSPPSAAQIMDKETINKFADIAKDRKTFGDVFRTAEEDAFAARPGEMKGVIESGGPTATAVDTRAAVQSAGDTVGDRIAGAQESAARGVSAAARDEQRIVQEGAKQLVGDQKALISRAKQELGDNLNIAEDVTSWGNKVMRDSGLADQVVTVDARDLKGLVSEDQLRTMLKGMAADLPANQRTEIGNIIGALENNSEAKISIDVLDNLRQRLNAAYKGDSTRTALRTAAKSLEALGGPEYQKFISSMSKLYTAGERLNKFKTAFGGMPKALEFADQIAGEADTLRRVMGKQGDDIVKSINATLRKMNGYADEITEIQTAAKNTAEGISDTKAARLAEINKRAKSEMAKLNAVVTANKDAINAASKVLKMPTGEFSATIERASPAAKGALEQVARGSVADTAGQSASRAVRTAGELSETATFDRLAKVVGEDEARKLQRMGQMQSKAARNLSELSPPRTADQFPDDTLSAALEAVAVPGAGAASRSHIIRRLFEKGQALGMTNKAAREVATALTSGDKTVLKELMFGIKRNQQQRAVAQALVRSLALERGNSTTEAMQGRQ